MNTINTSRFILHVSDFHLTDNNDDIMYAQSALKALTNKLSDEKIKVDYLVHTGDVIDSSDIYEKVAKELKLSDEFFSYEEDSKKKKFDKKIFSEKATDEQKEIFDYNLVELTKRRFKKAEDVFRKFISDLNISFGSVVICSGNHDILRFFQIANKSVTCEKSDDDKWNYTFPEVLEDSFVPFENFLDNLDVANSKKRCGSDKPVMYCAIDNLKFLILNTNWKNPIRQKQGYFCTRCDVVSSVVAEIPMSKNTLNIVLAHKPLYEICEKARLSYQRYIQTPFMSNLRRFIGRTGIYLCGDKHTRSIADSKFHDIPHYIGGEPLKVKTNGEVEYNLLEISGGKIEMERKLHLTQLEATVKSKFNWNCTMRPQDTVVSNLYEISKDYIISQTFGIIGIPVNLRSWERICQKIYDLNNDCIQPWYDNFNKQCRTICKYRSFGKEEVTLDELDIFGFVCERLETQVGYSFPKNALNIRGEYSSGKSTFLGLFFIYLLNQYYTGKINFLPAYFNIENREMSEKIKNGDSYFEAVKQAFTTYSKEIQKIAIKEHQAICFIIDGLDEQDCWRYSTEDSIGRALLDVLSEYNNAWYIMAFSQHRLPCFKNTMPTRKYNDSSDIMYFNPIDVRESGAEDLRFSLFVKSFFEIQKNSDFSFDFSDELANTEISDDFVDSICDIIRRFRRLTITPGFMYDNLGYIIEQYKSKLEHKDRGVSDIYNYYIDKQYEICLNKLGYNFIYYAPAMAYLFSFKGYTYEKFKYLQNDSAVNCCNTLKSICKHYDQMYHTFLFIKKHRDTREYLIALHYNRELRYYVEHPTESIDLNSILYEFIPRNIAVIVRKLWTDTNKFLIACETLLRREDLPACMQSMLVYCLAHIQMYAPIRDRLRKQLQDYGQTFLSKKDCDNWIIEGNDSVERLDRFINLSLKHSIEIFRLIDSNNSIQLVSTLLSNENFQKYNRQFQMLYYEDLSIKGEESRRALNPGCDLVYKGFDFHNCFYYLYAKLISPHSYPLREFDMFTLWDLIYSRLMADTLDKPKPDLETFFYRDKFNDRANMVLEHTYNIFYSYTTNSKSDATSKVFSYFELVRDTLKEIISIRKGVIKHNSEDIKGNSEHDSEIIDVLKDFNEKNPFNCKS